MAASLVAHKHSHFDLTFLSVGTPSTSHGGIPLTGWHHRRRPHRQVPLRLRGLRAHQGQGHHDLRHLRASSQGGLGERVRPAAARTGTLPSYVHSAHMPGLPLRWRHCSGRGQIRSKRSRAVARSENCWARVHAHHAVQSELSHCHQDDVKHGLQPYRNGSQLLECM